MRNRSKSNTHGTSTGERIASDVLDRQIRLSCKEVMQEQKEEHGYNFCVECYVNDRYAIIDPSHDISVKWCKENGLADLAAKKGNIRPRCRKCHEKRDGLNIQWTK